MMFTTEFSLKQKNQSDSFDGMASWLFYMRT